MHYANIKKHPAYEYARDVIAKRIRAPKYVRKQAKIFVDIWEDKNERFIVNYETVDQITAILSLLKMPKGLKMGQPLIDCIAGFQWLLIIASLCTVYRENPKRRRYETVVLEIARKNGKTFIVAVLFIILFFIEPQFSYFYSVAPDGSLSREIKKAIEEIIQFNPKVLTVEGADKLFKIRRDDIHCLLKNSKYIPLNYSNSRLDGKLPSVFLVDEVGALPNNYAIQAMRSGQLTILNKLGFIISTKYPRSDTPFEDEVAYSKDVLDGANDDVTVFALLYEPDDVKNWIDNNDTLRDANPLALEVPEIWDDLIKKRERAIAVERERENFLTKHCNIIFQGAGTETYIPIDEVKACRVAEPIDWYGRDVYVGVDLSQSRDNTSVAMVAYDEENDRILCRSWCFIPSGRIEEKSAFEKLDYKIPIRRGECFACGDMTIDYEYVEDFVFSLEEKYGVYIQGIGFDRYNAISSAQKWSHRYEVVEVRQHSDTLHAPTKLLSEYIANKKFAYEKNELYEVNYENARCTYDTNLNRYVNKKRSNGKVDMIFSTLDALYLLQQRVLLNDFDFFVQVE